MDNIRGAREGEEPGGGKYNPFRILEIGESMIRYCDGIRIKNYNFLAILTSDRLVLMESAQQSAGTIAKEIPVSMIRSAEMDRDEKNRPALAMSMEVGGQTRLMKLVFTGLIDEPETECREWFAAINGYPPEPLEITEPAHEPVQTPVTVPTPPPVPVSSPPAQEPSPIIDAEEVSPPPAPVPPVVPVSVPAPEPVPEKPVAQVVAEPAISSQVSSAPQQEQVISPSSPLPPTVQESNHQIPIAKEKLPDAPERPPIPVISPGEESVQIFIEKPGITPILLERKPLSPVGSTSGKTRFCIECGSRIPGSARFCPVCGKSQV